MNNKELKRLNRRELVDIIYQLKKNEEELNEELEQIKKELQDKRLHISNAGSIADAVMSMTNMVSNVQMTADLYLQEISCMKEDTEKECAKKIEDTEIVIQKIISNGKKEYIELKKKCKKDYIKWKRLKTEIEALEKKKLHELCEGVNNE